LISRFKAEGLQMLVNAGECHNCYGEEVILMSGQSRNKADAPGCGESAGTQGSPRFVLTRRGPSCYGLELDVYNIKPWIAEKMGMINCKLWIT